MTRQPRSNDLKSKGCTPQYECEGCKVGLVTVPRVNQECRLPGKSLVRRQVQGQTCRIKSVGDGQDPDRWDACPDKGTAAILAELRWRPHQRAADSRVKKWTCALTLLLAFPQRVPRPDKVSQTEFFYQRIRIEQGAKLEPVGKYRPVPDSDTQDSPNSTSISFHSCEIFSMFATAEVFHYLLAFSPFCHPFIIVYSYSVISLFIFFQLFPFPYITPACTPVLFFHKLLFSSVLYIKVCRRRENVILSNYIQVDVRGISYDSHLASFAANREKDK